MHAADLGCWENEPNDNSLQASGPLLADRSCLGRSTNGVISSPVGGAYKDYFRFYKLTAGRTRIRLEFAGEDAQLQIYREGAIGTRLNLDPFVHAVELNLSPDWYYVYVNFPAHSPDMVYVVTLQ